MGSHTQPSQEQLKPMIEINRNQWSGFTKAATVGVLSIVALLSLMALFLVKH